MGMKDVKTSQTNIAGLVAKRLAYYAMLAVFGGLLAFGLCGLASCLAILAMHWRG